MLVFWGSTVFHSVQDIGLFSLLHGIWSTANPLLMTNVISQSLGLDLVNTNVYAKVYHNNPLSSRDFHVFRIWSSAKPRQMMSFRNLLG